MRTPTPVEGLRLPVDDWVDRPDLEALQGVEVTGTNRPRACPQTLAFTVWFPDCEQSLRLNPLNLN
jgi:hypothetical protein